MASVCSKARNPSLISPKVVKISSSTCNLMPDSFERKAYDPAELAEARWTNEPCFEQKYVISEKKLICLLTEKFWKDLKVFNNVPDLQQCAPPIAPKFEFSPSCSLDKFSVIIVMCILV